MIRPIHGRTALAALGAAAIAGALAVASPATAAPAAAPTGQIHLAAGAEAIPGSYIVTLKGDPATKSASAVGQATSELAARYGSAVRYTYTSALSGFAATMSESAARQLAADPRVALVEQDSVVHTDVTQTGATWGIDRVDQRNLPLSGTYTYNTTATNVTAFVIDTGIRTAHTQFAGRASVGFDAIGDGQNGQDCNGHGTHVSGTIGGSTFGLAKGVRLVAVRVLSCAGSGTNAGVIAGIDFVTRSTARPAVANMSLGGGASATLDAAVRRSITAGVTYAIAAGNSNANACNFSPARTAEAITVGATTMTDARSSFSNFGTCVDIFAPGSAITSAWATSNTATNTISGTSMATPHTAGAAALYLATHATASPATVRNALVAAATPNVISNVGTGSPNRLLFTGTL
jgi:subtilisin family serine protease